jgi:hypothetical protein
MPRVLAVVVAILVAIATVYLAQQQSPDNEAGNPVVRSDASVFLDLTYVENGHERQV